MIRRLMVAAAVAALPVVAFAGDARRDAILADYADKARSADPAATAFSAQRGETLFRTKWTGGDPRTSSCTACHTADPRQPGQNAKTGRAIEPVAVPANPGRFTDPAAAEKHSCPSTFLQSRVNCLHVAREGRLQAWDLRSRYLPERHIKADAWLSVRKSGRAVPRMS